MYLSLSSNDPGTKSKTYGVMRHIAYKYKIQMGNNIATMEGTITALDGANVRHKEVATAMGVKLAVVVGQLTMATETGTHAFVLHSLVGEICLVVEAILPLFDWID